jgi:hypothetical protein
MATPARTPPKTHQMLSRWADGYARRIGEDVARVRRWIAYMAFGGALERAGFYGDGPRFTIKGGVALELRLRARARATRDLDLIVNHPTAALLDELDAALAASFERFSFRRHGSMRALPRGALRVEVGVQYSAVPGAGGAGRPAGDGPRRGALPGATLPGNRRSRGGSHPVAGGTGGRRRLTHSPSHRGSRQ